MSISTLIDNNNGCAFSGDALTFSGTTTFAGRYSDTNAYAFRMIVSNTTEFSGGVRGLRGSLIKQGTGALVLSGSVTNTGATQVNEGTLLINGTHTGGGTYTVASGATLGGRGTITAPVSVSGKLSPGASIESLATGALTFNGGSTFEVELDSSAALSVAADLVKVTGNLALDGTVQLTLTDLAASPSRFPAGTTLSLINYTGTWDNGLFTYAGNELAEAEQFAAGPTTWQISYAAVAGGSNYVGDYSAGHFVNLLSIPEPASLALVGGALAAALLRRRPAA